MDFHYQGWHGHIYPLGLIMLALPLVVLGMIAWMVAKKRAVKKR